MREDDERAVDLTFTTVVCVLAFGIVLFLLRPETAAMGSVPTANLYLAVPFVLLAVFCFQLVLEGSRSDFDETDGKNRT